MSKHILKVVGCMGNTGTSYHVFAKPTAYVLPVCAGTIILGNMYYLSALEGSIEGEASDENQYWSG